MAYYQDDDAFLDQLFGQEDTDLASYYDRYEEAIRRFPLAPDFNLGHDNMHT